jgi:hypothetical protein
MSNTPTGGYSTFYAAYCGEGTGDSTGTSTYYYRPRRSYRVTRPLGGWPIIKKREKLDAWGK